MAEVDGLSVMQQPAEHAGPVVEALDATPPCRPVGKAAVRATPAGEVCQEVRELLEEVNAGPENFLEMLLFFSQQRRGRERMAHPGR